MLRLRLRSFTDGLSSIFGSFWNQQMNLVAINLTFVCNLSLFVIYSTVLQEDPSLGKTLNTTKGTIKDILTTDNPLDANSDSRHEDGSNGNTLSDPTLEELGETSDVDESMEEDEDLGSEGILPMQTPGPTMMPTSDPAIGEGNLLCPENWVCNREGK